MGIAIHAGRLAELMAAKHQENLVVLANKLLPYHFGVIVNGIHHMTINHRIGLSFTVGVEVVVRGHNGWQARVFLHHAGGKVESGLGIGIGDGWMRFMEFDMSGKDPVVHVRTYSTHYDVQSTDHKEYAEWYKDHEQPHMTEAQFRSGDDFKLKLNGFSKRFATKAALVNQ